MPKRSAKRTQQQRVRLGEMQNAVKEQAVRWIEGLDILVHIEYSNEGEMQTMTVTGVPKK